MQSDFFGKTLELSPKSIDYCKNIIGLMVNHSPSLDFFVAEREIPREKAKYYHTLAFSRKKKDFNIILKRIGHLIPVNFGEIFRKIVIDMDENLIFQLILAYARDPFLKNFDQKNKNKQ
jgi:hypothetical protein